MIFGAVGLLLTACDGGWEVVFREPFPRQAADMAAFPARHQGVYTAADPGRSLCIGRTAVWRQELQTMTSSRHYFDSLGYHLRADSTYLDGHTPHYLQRVGADSVRDSWLWTDTIFSIIGLRPGHLRRFQGRYYLAPPRMPKPIPPKSGRCGAWKSWAVTCVGSSWAPIPCA